MSKILFIVDGYPDKQSIANIFVQNQVKAISAFGFEVAVLIIDVRSIRHIRRFGFYKEDKYDIPIWRVSFPWGAFFQNTGQKVANFIGCWAYKKIQLLFGKPDIIHAHFGEVGIIGANIKKEHNIPLVITEHGSSMLSGKRTIHYKQKIVYQAYEKCDQLIVVGTNLSNHIKDMGFENMVIIPNIIPSYFYFPKNKEQLIKKKKQFITIGSLLESKRFDLTISAFARICKISDDTTLAIIGTGKLSNFLQRLVKEKGIEEKVRFYGFVSNICLPELFNESICFVLPSDYETFGVVYAEAIASGIPAIATKCGGPEDIINNSNGLLIPKNDEDALFEAMLFMYLNSSSYNPEFISEDICKRFGEESVGRRIVDVYSEIIRKYLPN